MRLLQYAFILILVFHTGLVDGQSKIDSLHKQLEKSLTQSEKNQVYLALAVNYNQSQIDSALYFARSALKGSLQIEDTYQKGLSYLMIGDIFSSNPNA